MCCGHRVCIGNTGHEVLNPFEENKLGHGPHIYLAAHIPCTNKHLVIELGRYLDEVKYKHNSTDKKKASAFLHVISMIDFDSQRECFGAVILCF